MNNSFLALPVGRVGWGYNKKLFINSNKKNKKKPLHLERQLSWKGGGEVILLQTSHSSFQSRQT